MKSYAKDQSGALPSGAHGTSPAKKAPNVARTKHTIVSGQKYIAKPLNHHRAQPGFKGKVA